MATQPETKVLSPPYVAFATFKTMIAGFKEHVLPSRIDRSVLGNFSGAVGGQLITTLRFLGLVNVEHQPTQGLKALVESINTDKWSEELGATLKRGYASIFLLDLKSATPSQFSEHFAKTYPGESSTQRKCMTFFLTAVQEAKLPISPFILKNKKPRSAPTKRRVAAKTQRRTLVEEPDGDDFQPQPERKLSEHVLAILDDKELKPEVEKAVYVILKYLREEGK